MSGNGSLVSSDLSAGILTSTSSEKSAAAGGLGAETRIGQLQRLLTSLKNAKTNGEAEAAVGRMDVDLRDKLAGQNANRDTVDKRFVTALRDLNQLQRSLKTQGQLPGSGGGASDAVTGTMVTQTLANLDANFAKCADFMDTFMQEGGGSRANYAIGVIEELVQQYQNLSRERFKAGVHDRKQAMEVAAEAFKSSVEDLIMQSRESGKAPSASSVFGKVQKSGGLFSGLSRLNSEGELPNFDAGHVGTIQTDLLRARVLGTAVDSNGGIVFAPVSGPQEDSSDSNSNSSSRLAYQLGISETDVESLGISADTVAAVKLQSAIASRDPEMAAQQKRDEQAILALRAAALIKKASTATSQKEQDKIMEGATAPVHIARDSKIIEENLSKPEIQDMLNAQSLDLYMERLVHHLLRNTTVDLAGCKPSELSVDFDHDLYKKTQGSLRFELRRGGETVSQVIMLHGNGPEVSARDRGKNLFLMPIQSRLKAKQASLNDAYKSLMNAVRQGATATWSRSDESFLAESSTRDTVSEIMKSIGDDTAEADDVRGSLALGDPVVAWPLIAFAIAHRQTLREICEKFMVDPGANMFAVFEAFRQRGKLSGKLSHKDKQEQIVYVREAMLDDVLIPAKRAYLRSKQRRQLASIARQGYCKEMAVCHGMDKEQLEMIHVGQTLLREGSKPDGRPLDIAWAYMVIMARNAVADIMNDTELDEDEQTPQEAAFRGVAEILHTTSRLGLFSLNAMQMLQQIHNGRPDLRMAGAKLTKEQTIKQQVHAVFGKGPTANSVLAMLPTMQGADASMAYYINDSMAHLWSSVRGSDGEVMGIRALMGVIAGALGHSFAHTDLVTKLATTVDQDELKKIMKVLHRCNPDDVDMDPMMETLRTSLGLVQATVAQGSGARFMLERGQNVFQVLLGSTGYTKSRTRTKLNAQAIMAHLKQKMTNDKILSDRLATIQNAGRLFEGFTQNQARDFVDALAYGIRAYGRKNYAFLLDTIDDMAMKEDLLHYYQLQRGQRKPYEQRMHYARSRVNQLFISRIDDLPREQQDNVVNALRNSATQLLASGNDFLKEAVGRAGHMWRDALREGTSGPLYNIPARMALFLVHQIYMSRNDKVRLHFVRSFASVLRPRSLLVRPTQSVRSVAKASTKIQDLSAYKRKLNEHGRLFAEIVAKSEYVRPGDISALSREGLTFLDSDLGEMVQQLEAAIRSGSTSKLSDDHCTLLVELVYPTLQKYHSNVKLSQAEYSYFPAEADSASRAIAGSSTKTPTETPPPSSAGRDHPGSATHEVNQIVVEYVADRDADLVRTMTSSKILAREFRRMALELHWGLQFVTVGSLGDFMHNTSFPRDAEQYDDHLEGTFDFEAGFIYNTLIGLGKDGRLTLPLIGDAVEDMKKFEIKDISEARRKVWPLTPGRMAPPDTFSGTFFDPRMLERLRVDLLEQTGPEAKEAATARATQDKLQMLNFKGSEMRPVA